ncbi:lipase chaperone [Leptospira sp. 2 VSF19]|uniref:Lipase helper protein n=1 Tax=Leptospira soteropolitanensis TaxID=2950025 RepID=A0AAW5VET8_9LEPT|nr:lipase secretion chaperone [Leptospira soteropolitanensis]MCW7493992.1 lipase chaperone [Leptospira soteropolitanensis]MCW7501586.1 lipase chaperone [Leptospira soteropolitanensis]MCW7523652.1 lipase chaperone [Leptospira soteropolitanensis]MCW7527515.1 lipase chaperone [Leptospira soteropolitanensis]MCW7531369.1 lipase chaperone [Leptospira soteropolitanensis]
MNFKNFRYLSMAFGALLLIYIVYRIINPNTLETTNEENPNDIAESYFRTQSDGFSVDPFYLESAKTIFSADGRFLRFDEILGRAKSGELNLVSELWNLRRQCPEGSTREQCHEYIKAFLKNEYSGDDAKRLINMLSNYLKYEEAMVQLDPSSKSYSNQERYEQIKQLRRKYFSKEDAELIFGLEEATADFSFNRKNFLDETKNLKADERLRLYEDYRKKSFGNFYNAVVAREPLYDKFENEMDLRQAELSKLSGLERESKEKEVRIRYFGKDGNDRMEKVLKEMKEEEEKISKLQVAEKNLLKNYPNLSESEREKKIMELRIQTLGSKELAEEYTRRMEYEKTLKNSEN